jgi:hypothetical protein
VGQAIVFYRLSSRAAAAVFLMALSAAAKDRIASIEFFGSQGIDVDAVRKALPFHPGDPMKTMVQAQARETVKRVTGSDATNVAAVCCVKDGDTVIFIGLPGTSSRAFPLNPRPTGNLELQADLQKIYRAMKDAEDAASSGLESEPPAGYRLMQDPAAHAVELKLRDAVRPHAEELIRVLSRSSDAEQRSMAADGLGYVDRSAEQIDALVQAARDPSDNVRNYATRALMEILRGDPKASSQVPAAPFIEMLHSGIWTDRNKASGVLWSLSESRDVALMATLKARAWDALLEMARWPSDWRLEARVMLARIAGLDERRALELWTAPIDEFLAAIGAR